MSCPCSVHLFHCLCSVACHIFVMLFVAFRSLTLAQLIEWIECRFFKAAQPCIFKIPYTRSCTLSDIYHEKFSEHAVKCTSFAFRFHSLQHLLSARRHKFFQRIRSYFLFSPAPVGILKEFSLIGNLSLRFQNHQKTAKQKYLPIQP